MRTIPLQNEGLGKNPDPRNRKEVMHRKYATRGATGHHLACTTPRGVPPLAGRSRWLRRLVLGLLLLGPAGAHSSAVVDLGDITALTTSQAESGRLAETEAVQTYRFTLTATKAVTLWLWLAHADADLYLEAADGTLLHGSEQPGPVAEWIAAVLPAGAYAVQVEAREAGETPYTFHYEVEEPRPGERVTPRALCKELKAECQRGPGERVTPRAIYYGGEEEYMSEWMLAMQAEAVELGDITDLADQDWRRGEISYGDDDSYRFTLTESKDVSLRLTEMEGNVNLFLYDADINKLDDSVKSGLADDTISKTLRAGTYYVIVRDFAGWGAELSYALGYTVSAASEELPPLEDDFPHDTGTEGTVPLVDGSGEATGDIEFRGDRDWFRIALEKGQTYELHLRGLSTDHGTLRDPVLQLHDADGVAIPLTGDTYSGVGNNAWQFFTPPLDPEAEDCGDIECVPSDDPAPPGPRTYYIEARAYRDTVGRYGGHKGTYTISVSEYTSPEDDDYPSFVPLRAPDVPAEETPAGPVTLTEGVPFPAEIETVGDRDWFGLNLEAGRSYTLKTLGRMWQAGTLAHDLLCGIYDEHGRVVTDGVDQPSWVRLIFDPSRTGRYYVCAGADNSKIRARTIGTYTILLTGSGSPDPDVLETFFSLATEVGVGVPVVGELEYGNHLKWYEMVGLEAGTTYQVDLKGAATGDGTLLDPHVALRQVERNTEGAIADTDTVRDDNSGEGYNSRLEVTGGGEYYLVAGASHAPDAVEDGFFATGTYTLVVTDPAAEPTDPPEEETDRVPPDENTLRTVAVGGIAKGAIERFACEWVTVELEAGTTYRVDLAGAATGSGTLADPSLAGLYDPEGRLIPGTTNDDGGAGLNSQVTVTPQTTGTYAARVCAYGAGHGSYTLSVEVIANDLPADPSTAGQVTVGGAPVTGEVQAAGDLDWFGVELVAGQSYVLGLAGGQDGCPTCTLLEPHLYGLYDAEGRLMPDTAPAVSAGRVHEQHFTPPATGRYYIAVGAHGDGIGTYTVEVRVATAGS